MGLRHQTEPRAYKLLHEGNLALAEIEHNGARVDKGRLDKALADTATEIADSEAELKSDEVWTEWRKVHGQKAKLGSGPQLAVVLFGRYDPKTKKRVGGMGFKPEAATATGRDSTDKSALDYVDLPFARKYVALEELKKARSTYLVGIRREMVERDGDWFVHPNYNLNTTITYRPSCDKPNYMNIPTRNPRIAKIIRQIYIPRRGFDITEIDFSTLEVAISCAYHKDPKLMKYVAGGGDMHGDTARELFKLRLDQVDKKTARDSAKNQFVFPEFYGDAYFSCAKAIWDRMVRQKWVIPGTNKLVKDHLAEQGITALGACDPKRRPEPGTFEHHVKQVEDRFWNVRFPAYTAWKKRWYEAYRRDGGFMMYTGFAVNGLFSRNDVINYPVQGSAFHCLLWSLVKMLKWLRKYKMASLLIGQIYDSFQGDTKRSELDDYIGQARKIMTEDLPKAWDWINVPLKVEAEVAPEGFSWYDKQVFAEKGGRWRPADAAKWLEKFGTPWAKA